MRVKATVNGRERDISEGATLATLIGDLGLELKGIAVARNDEVVRRADLAHAKIGEGDRIEIIKAVAGG